MSHPYMVFFTSGNMRTKVHAHNKIQITYPDPLAIQWTQMLDLKCLTDLLSVMHEEHAHLNKENKIQVLRQAFPNRFNSANAQFLHELNEPTLEAIFVLDRCPEIWPKAHDKIFMTTATANSGNDPAFYNALKICDVDLTKLQITKTSTCLMSGKTGVSNTRCHNAAIRYNESVSKDQWHMQSTRLFAQLMKKNKGDVEYDIIYHWGCISQQWTKAPWGTMTSSWLYHEAWNWVYTIAMMRHAVASLKSGGKLVLKCRVFKKAESMGLLAMLSSAFRNCKILSNPRQLCTFVTFVGTDFHGTRHENVQKLQHDLSQCTDYSLSSIFTSVSFSNGSAFMAKCEEARTDMLTRESTVYTAWLFAMHVLRSALQNRCNSVLKCRDHDAFIHYLCKVYAGKTQFVDLLLRKLDSCYSQLLNNKQEKDMFLRVMQSRWMKASC